MKRRLDKAKRESSTKKKEELEKDVGKAQQWSMESSLE